MPQDATEEKPLGRGTCDPSCRRGSRPTTDELLPGPASSRRDDDATAMPGGERCRQVPADDEEAITRNARRAQIRPLSEWIRPTPTWI